MKFDNIKKFLKDNGYNQILVNVKFYDTESKTPKSDLKIGTVDNQFEEITDDYKVEAIAFNPRCPMIEVVHKDYHKHIGVFEN